MRQTVIALAAALILLAACAPLGQTRPAARKAPERSAPSAHGDIPGARFEDLAQATQPVVLLRSPSGVIVVFETARAKLVYATATKIAAAAGGAMPELRLLGTPSINAFATYQNAQPVIGITAGMMNLLKDDAGAWGALIGHELAHFRLDHHQAGRSRQEAVELGSLVAGVALSVIGLGIGNVFADATGALVERSISRDDERDADRAGLEYARCAGLDPQGALRLQQRLQEALHESAFTFLSTHPSGKDRFESIRRMLEQPAPIGPR